MAASDRVLTGDPLTGTLSPGPRSIAEKSWSRVRVADYAVGNGTADDTAAVEAAGAALEANGGGVLDFGPATKTYKVTSIKLRSNVTYEGRGATVIGSSATPEAVFEAPGFATTTAISDSHVNGFVIDGGGVARRGVFHSRSTRCNVTRNVIKNLGGSETAGVRLHRTTTNCLVENNDITLAIDEPFGTLVTAAGVSCVSNVPDNQGGGQNATLAFGTASELSYSHIIRGNTIRNGTHSIMLIGATDCDVSSNLILSPTHRGVILSPIALRNTITKNRIRDYGSTGIHLAWGSRWNVINNNSLNSATSAYEGNGIKGYYGCSDNTVVGNVVDGALFAAIRFAMSSSRNVVESNRVNGAGIGVQIQSSLSAASGYYQPASAPDAIGNVVTGNSITGCPKGVELESGATASVRSTTVSDNNVDGSTTASYFVGELTSTSTVTATSAVGNVSTGTATHWTLPRGERHFAHKTGNTGLMPSPQTSPLRSGLYYQATPSVSVTTSAALGTNVFRCAPMKVPTGITLSRVGLEVTAAGDAGSTIRLGIYADDGNGYPKTLVADVGTVSADAVAVAEVTTSIALEAGTYWVGAVVQGVTTTSPTVRAIGGSNAPSFEGVPLTTGAAPGVNQVASFAYAALGISGALPTAFPSTVNLTQVVGRVVVKIA